jgi:glyoxylase-like metal-dependent hydrolase (beta-lactamase superfamily II)
MAGDGRAKIKITAFSTGTANCHVRQTSSPQDISTLRRKAGIMLDKEWAGPLPINTYLIEHPEGLILIDTGDSARNSEHGYMPRLNPFFRYAVHILVAPEEEIGPQLKAIGVNPARDVGRVVLTHLHHDHTGGLNHFPHSEIIASDACMKAARRKRGLIGAVPRTWPTWFDPTPFQFDGPAVGAFPRSAPLTKDGSIFALETPGHMAGHTVIVARGEEMTYVLAGDLTYRESLLLEDAVDGVTENVQESLASQQAVKALGAAEPTVLLPAHDPGAAARLAGGRTMFPDVLSAELAPTGG